MPSEPLPGPVVGVTIATTTHHADVSGNALMIVEQDGDTGHSTVDEVFAGAGRSFTAPLTVVDSDGTTIFSFLDNGELIQGRTDDIVADSPSHSKAWGLWARPFQSGQQPGGLFINGNMNIWQIGDPVEFNGSFTPGALLEAELTLTYLKTQIVDITTVTEVEVDELVGTNTWPSGGCHFAIQRNGASANEIAVMSCTGRNLTTGKLTGVTYIRHSGSATFDVGCRVYRVAQATSAQVLLNGTPDMGSGTGGTGPGRLGRVASIALVSAEDMTLDGYGGLYAGGYINFYTGSPGPASAIHVNMRLTEKGNLWLFGSWAEDTAQTPLGRRLIVAAKGTTITSALTIPNPASGYDIQVDDPSSFPTSADSATARTLTIQTSAGVEEITYTDVQAVSGHWYFTGCTGGTIAATAPAGRIVRLSKTALAGGNWPVASFRGNGVFFDFADDKQVEVGSVGPSGEGGIRWGRSSGGGPVVLFKGGTDYIQLGAGDKLRLTNASTAGIVLESRVGSESVNRWQRTADGSQFWGDGTNAVDASVKRSAAGELSVRNGDDTAYGDLRIGKFGVNGSAAVAQSTGWSATNVTTDKTFDANATTVDELADVLGTLINYLKTRGDLAA